MILLYKFFYEYVHIKWMLYFIIFNKGILSSNILLSLFCGFRNAYNMILHQFGDKLYSGLVATMTSHLKEMARSVAATEGSSFLEELNTKWNDHNEALRMIRDILMHADMTYFPQIKKTHVYKLGLNLWRENVIYSNQIRTRLSNTLLEFVFKEHAAEDVNREPIRNLSKMLMDLGPFVYEEEFETPFLQVSAEFYRAESQKFVDFSDCGDYFKKVAKRLNEETDRLSHLLDTGTKEKITNMLKETIENHMLRLIQLQNSGLVNMLCGDKYNDLGRMYNLFHRVPDGLLKIREVMTSHNRESILDPVEFVQRLLDEKDKYDKIINLEFSNNNMFQNVLNSWFEFFINLNPCSPEYISLFVDDKLRKGLNGVSEDDLEVTLEKVMMLFRYLQEKDVFEKYYTQHLAKRLLAGKTVSEDAERSLIIKLKKECGYQFTSKLEGMLKDMKASLDTTKGFYANHPELGDGPILTMQVLTTGFWPTQSSVTCNLPAEMSALCVKFQSYYLGNQNGRRLSWQTEMGTADLKATFGNGQKHELNVSTYQMCVLMLFNNADRLSYREIEQATEIPASDLKRCLQSLALVKGRNVLRKEPMSKDVSEDDAFIVNDKFSSKLYKVKIGTVVTQKESEPEKLKIRQRVVEDQKPQIEAAIVRIMKSRKQLEHNNLIAEVTKQLQSRFLANPTDIKKRIESLIERDFLERDDSDRKLYLYLA
ncbi:putative cullin protein, neddylation [Medicago truncatula]|uniref:Putative cullin protein, neddylation n=1 Tax=Medicago truncatula TaxID=3880 RepID=A0A396GYC4_MEDTR|nr:putative cullin protein, neddylation [Medicago truncatula]